MKNNKLFLGIVSFLFPGLGHIIIGKKKKGTILLILAFILMFIAVGLPVASFILMIVDIYAIIDCLNEVEKKRTHT